MAEGNEMAEYYVQLVYWNSGSGFSHSEVFEELEAKNIVTAKEYMEETFWGYDNWGCDGVLCRIVRSEDNVAVSEYFYDVSSKDGVLVAA